MGTAFARFSAPRVCSHVPARRCGSPTRPGSSSDSCTPPTRRTCSAPDLNPARRLVVTSRLLPIGAGIATSMVPPKAAGNGDAPDYVDLASARDLRGRRHEIWVRRVLAALLAVIP